MHVLYVHKNYPAQFGHVADYLVKHNGFQCTFVSARKPVPSGGIRRIQYKVRSGATAKTHYCSRSFENFTWQSHAVYEAMKAHPEVKPDLVVGHSGFGSTLFLPQLYDCPIINYCEWYYGSRASDADFRCEFPANELNALRSRIRNAMLLADLQCCSAGYSPTNWQRSRFPSEYQYKLETIFDGIDTDLWRRREAPEGGPRRIGDRIIPSGTKIITYVSRGFESMRGFDVFMKIAKRICDQREDVVFVCVGSDRCCYGNDKQLTKGKSYREHVLAQDGFDLERFLFTGPVPRNVLADILSASDLHVYLTVPFVLSWSLMNALACGCTVLASDTEPVREMIDHGRNGLLSPFYDIDGFVTQAMEVLDDPKAFRSLGEAGAEMIRRQYSLKVVIPKMLDLYERTLSGRADCSEARSEADHPTVVAEAPATDGINRLAMDHPWPREKPETEPCKEHGWVRPAHRRMLGKAIHAETRLVVETGAWVGLTTRVIADHASAGKVIAIDQWKESSGHGPNADWKAMLPDVYKRFLANCWPCRERVIPMSLPTALGLRKVHACQAKPDVIYLHAEHTRALESDLRLASELFPQAVLLGDNWLWPRVQRAVGVLVGNDFLELDVAGNMWRVWRE